MFKSNVSQPAMIALLGTIVLNVTSVRAAESEATVELATITVTAQKREQNLQDVGTSITALDASALGKLGLTDFTDITRQVPGLQFNQFSPTITVFNLRGVSQNDFSDHQEAPVAVYSDEAYVASPGAIAGAMYDLERVEVLRGPQGTLFGRNATGGLIHYISKKPSDDENGFVEVTYGRFNQIKTVAAINEPINDHIDTRLSLATNYHDGLITNRIGPDTENQRQYAARWQTLFKFNEGDEFLLKFHGIRNADETATAYSWAAAVPNAQGLGVLVGANENPWGTCNGCDLGGYRNPGSDPYDQAYGRPGGGIFDRTLYGATGHLSMRFGRVDFASITDFVHMHKRYGEETDGSPNLLFIYDTFQRYRQFSQEFRLNGDAGSVHWITGLYYLNLYSDDTANPTFADFLGGPTGTAYNVKTQSWAVFAQGEWDISDHWKAIVGGRVTQDEKTDNYLLYAPTIQSPIFAFNTTLYPDLAHRSWTLPSGKLELDYRISSDDMLYASINRGVKGGGFVQPSSPPALTPNQIGFNPEKLTSYEAGLKSTLLDGRMRLNADVFYYDYKDYQAYEQEGLVQAIANLQSRIKGAELEMAIVPTKGLELHLGVAGLDTVIKNVALPGGQIEDRAMPQAPKWSVNALAQYQWSALNATWTLAADSKTDTSLYFSTFNSPVDREPGKTVANVRATYTNGAGHFDLTLFCNNVNNRLYRVYDLDLSVVGFITQVYAPPRWYGASFTYHWK